MKKVLGIIVIFTLILVGCSSGESGEHEAVSSEEIVQSSEPLAYDADVLRQTFSDWVLGTEYGIDEVVLNDKNRNVEIMISQDNYDKLADYDFDDIKMSVEDILSFYEISGDWEIVFSNGETLGISAAENTDTENDEQTGRNNNQSIYDGDIINLIFIHHSVGENWLNAGLNEMLNENSIHVADTYYGWGEIGDRTDTTDWPDWFDNDIMPTVYSEMGNMTGYNTIEPAMGENTIIMFKSCYPNSNVGSSIEDEKRIYLSLLDYFSIHPDKMFVLITPPPMQRISNAQKTRELTNWLVSSAGWRKDYTENNLCIFDFYNVLTAANNHHMLVDGQEQHIVDSSSNTLHYDSGGDDHPNDAGSYKAAEEFVPLLMLWYEDFINLD